MQTSVVLRIELVMVILLAIIATAVAADISTENPAVNYEIIQGELYMLFIRQMSPFIASINICVHSDSFFLRF